MLHHDAFDMKPATRLRYSAFRHRIHLGAALLLIVALLLPALPVSLPTLPATPDVHAETPLGDFGDIWTSIEIEDTHDLAWGDMDNDGDLDLAVANTNVTPGRVYRNNDGTLESFWESPHSYRAEAVAWGDYDNDGDLDLILGNSDYYGLFAYEGLYRNDGGTFTPDLSWIPYNMQTPSSLIWGDIDGDSDLDLITGSQYHNARIYLNENGSLSNLAVWQNDIAPGLVDIALGDLDNDGDLDMVIGYNTYTSLYRNDGGTFPTEPTLTMQSGDTNGIDLGDYDGDGDLDLLEANQSDGTHVYRNRQVEQSTTDFSVMFADSAVWINDIPNTNDGIMDAVWGDYDNDGDLDIGAGISYGKNIVYRNDGNDTFTKIWQAPGLDTTSRVAWADVDGDGVLDFISANQNQPTRIAFNNDGGSTDGAAGDGGLLPFYGMAVSPADGVTEAVALADYDNDGDLDLTVGNNYRAPSEIYRNDGGVFSSAPVWTSPDNEDTYDIDWIDYDNDGDLDMASINFQQVDRLYRNDGVDSQGQPILTAFPINSAIENTALAGAWGDYDNDGDLDLAVANSQPWSYNGDYWYGDLEVNDLYRNDGVDASGAPVFTLAWQSVHEAELSYDIEWGDMDGDGDLDLVVANEGHPNRMYRNDQGQLTEHPTWSSRISEPTSSVALADYDNDGDLDLAFGNRHESNALYRNDNGVITDVPVWASPTSQIAYDIAWADYDNDGDLDLAAAHPGSRTFLYRNEDGVLNSLETWADYDTDNVVSLVWGDVDNDGDQDLITGSRGKATLLYHNRLHDHAAQNTPAHVAINESGDGFNLTARLNEDPIIPIEYTLTHPAGEQVGEVRAFYSMDGGGHWLPAVASSDTITRNLETAREGTTTIHTAEQTAAETTVQNIPDSGTLDSDLSFGGAGTLAGIEPELSISHPRSSQLSAELWAPWPDAAGTTVTLFENLDADGTNPVTVRFSDSAAAPLPTGGTTNNTATYASSDVPTRLPSRGTDESTLTVPDGGSITDLDVVAMNGRHYRVSDLSFTLRSPAGTEVMLMYRPCNNQNHFDLSFDDEAASGNWPCPPRDGGTYRPENPLSAFDGEESAGTWTLIVEDHRNGRRGRLDGWGLRITTETTGGTVLESGTYQPAGALAAFDGMPSSVPVTLRMTDQAANHSGTLDSWSLDAVVATEETTAASDGTHTFAWDTFASGFFGQSDHVAFRIEALPNSRAIPHDVSRTYQYGHSAAYTSLFRVRGTQVRVVDEQGDPVPGAIVYQLAAGQQQGGNAMMNDQQRFFTTDNQGYLQGRGTLAIGDRLLALAPAKVTDTYTLYHTNGTPTEASVESASVETPGVQTLTVSADNPLMLFDITVALEWDASEDPSYLQQLAFNIKRASQYLYDFTDGQVALGMVNVTQNADDWAYAEVVVRANNSLRPWANQGGIVLDATTDPQHSDIVYNIGQVTMGSTWNRYGEPGTNLGDDWAVVLAHELGHYFLFLDDAYVGLGPNDLLIPVDTCQGTAMGDPYTDQDNSEFIWDDAYWQANCAATLTNQTLQRNEWETIDLWYPELNMPTATNAGPGLMPFSLTDVQVDAPITPTNALEDPTFYLDYIGNGLSSNQAQVYLQRNLDGDDIYDYVLPMGGPIGGQNRIKAHGAQPGDRLCAFDPEHQYFGCEVIELGDERLSLQRDETWLPVIQLTPITTDTFDIAVSNVPEGLSLKAQLYPELGYSYEAIDLAWSGDRYEGSFLMDLPEMVGHIAVWVDEPGSEEAPRREAMVAYSVGGNPGSHRRSNTDLRGGGGSHRRSNIDLRGGGGSHRRSNIDPRGGGGSHRRSNIDPRGGGGSHRRSNTDLRGGGGSHRRSNAPVMSADGQMTFYTRNPVAFPEGEFYSIQTMAGLPDVPAGRTVIGQGYSLVTTANAPALDGSISFEYLTGDVRVEGMQEDEEADDLKIYYWDGVTWEMLPTTVDAYYNFVSAPGRGAGVYALMASTEIALYTAGWNLIAYPIRETQPVIEALRSIEGTYTQVYGFEPDGQSDPWTPYVEGDTESPWRRYDVSLPAWANTLTDLEFGRGYWINITEATTIHLGEGNASVQAEMAPSGQVASLPTPPATFHGRIDASEEFVPQAGMPITAKVGDAVCGRTTTQEVDGEIVYVVDVLAASSGSSAACGTAGSQVTFEVDGTPMRTTATWDNSSSHALPLNQDPAAGQMLYLPLVVR